MGRKEIDQLLIRAANTFLIGEGPTIAIISAFLPHLDKDDNLKRHALLQKRIAEYDGLYLFDLLGSWDYSDTGKLLEKSVVVSGLTLSQILKIVREFEQKAFIMKDWDGTVSLNFENFRENDRKKVFIQPKELESLKIVSDPFDKNSRIVSFRYPGLAG